MSTAAESLFASPPPDICAACVVAAPRHWISGTVLYCPHTKSLAVRVPAVGETWSVSRVKPKPVTKQISKWHSTARALMARVAMQSGLSLVELEQGLTDGWLELLQVQERESPGPRAHRG